MVILFIHLEYIQIDLFIFAGRLVGEIMLLFFQIYKLSVFFSFLFSLKRFSLTQLNNDMCGVGSHTFVSFAMGRFEDVQLIFFYLFATLWGKLKCNCYLTALKMQSFLDTTSVCVFYREPFLFRISCTASGSLRPVSHLIKACLHDAMFSWMIKLTSSYSLGTVVFYESQWFFFLHFFPDWISACMHCQRKRTRMTWKKQKKKKMTESVAPWLMQTSGRVADWRNSRWDETRFSGRRHAQVHELKHKPNTLWASQTRYRNRIIQFTPNAITCSSSHWDQDTSVYYQLPAKW